MKFRYLAVAATAVFLPFAATACGADSTGELDKGELVDELEKGGMDAAQADCMADALIDADFTKDEIDDLNAGDTDVNPEKTEAFTEAATECVLGDTGS
jgi:hypothetical protein